MNRAPGCIRLRYSSMVNYASMIYRLLIAVGFVVIVARRLSIEEFGLWGVILSSSMMLAVPVYLWGWWAQRMHVRGEMNAAGTGLWITLAYLVPGSLLYLAVAAVESRVVGWGFWDMMAGLPILVILAIDSYLALIAGVVKPELVGYRGFLYETMRITLAYVAVVWLGLGLRGAIYAVEVGLGLGAAYLAAQLVGMGVLRLGFSSQLASSWLRGAVVPGVNVTQRFLREAVRTVLSWVTGSEVPVAYLNMGLATEAPLLRASTAITPALYARSLRGGDGGDLEESLRLYLLFTGFMLTVFLILAKPIVSLYNPAYVDAYMVVPLVSIYAALSSLAMLYVAALQGSEVIDLPGVPAIRDMVTSYLFKAPSALLGGMALSYAAMIVLVPIAHGYVAVAEAAAIALIVGAMASVAWLARAASQRIPHRPPLREALHVLLASLAVASYFMVSGAHGIEVTRFWDQAPLLAIHMVMGAVIYAMVLYVGSGWFRELSRSFLAELSSIRK